MTAEASIIPDISPPVKLPGLVLPALHQKFTRDGTAHFREAKIPMPCEHAFRQSWRTSTRAWRERGYTVRQHEGAWLLAQWLMPVKGGYTLTKYGREQVAMLGQPQQQSLALQTPTPTLELEPLPHGLEDKLRDYQVEPARQLYRALRKGPTEWGYSGAVDFSDMGTGKTYQDLAAALATGLQVGVLCPSVGQPGWQRAFDHYGAEPLFISTYEAVRGAWRPQIATMDATGKFTWTNPRRMILILDEAQACRHDDTLTVQCCSSAIRQGIPIIMASATIAISPTEFRFAGRITGLHKGDDDWPRFLREHGCVKTGGSWTWDRRSHHLERINARLFPRRGCRVRKQDLGEDCPETIIEVLPFDIPEAGRLNQTWLAAQEFVDRLRQQGMPEGKIKSIERTTRMKTWHRTERALAPYVAERVRQDVRDGNSVAIFTNFTDCREEIGRMLNTRAGFYGGQNKKIRAYYESQFQSNREFVLVSNIGAGGASVSLHDIHGERPRIAYLFPTDDPIKFSQATGRVDRVGGQSLSRQFIPCVKGTLTEQIVHRTRQKMARIDIINDGRRSSASPRF